MISIKKISYATLTLLLAVVVIGTASIGIKSLQVIPEAQAETAVETLGYLSGYAWSSNIGWISLSCKNSTSGCTDILNTTKDNYGVSLTNANAGKLVPSFQGSLNGYAWSDNIGWIKFGGGLTRDGQTEEATQAKLITTDAIDPNNPGAGNFIAGWVRACAGTVDGDCASASRDDGWDGWISLSSATDGISGNGHPYGVSVNGTNAGGYAWGGDVVGWVSFDGVTIKYPNTSDTKECSVTKTCDTTFGYSLTPSTTSALSLDKPKPQDGTITITKTFGTAEKVSVVFDAPDGITLTPKATSCTPDTSGTCTIGFTLETSANTIEKTYRINVTGTSANTTDQKIHFDVQVIKDNGPSNPKPFNYSLGLPSIATLAPGKISPEATLVVNKVAGTAQDVTISFDKPLPGGIAIDPTSSLTCSLDSGSCKVLFKVTAGSTDGTYSIGVTGTSRNTADSHGSFSVTVKTPPVVPCQPGDTACNPNSNDFDYSLTAPIIDAIQSGKTSSQATVTIDKVPGSGTSEAVTLSIKPIATSPDSQNITINQTSTNCTPDSRCGINFTVLVGSEAVGEYTVLVTGTSPTTNPHYTSFKVIVDNSECVATPGNPCSNPKCPTIPVPGQVCVEPPPPDNCVVGDARSECNPGGGGSFNYIFTPPTVNVYQGGSPVSSSLPINKTAGSTSEQVDITFGPIPAGITLNPTSSNCIPNAVCSIGFTVAATDARNATYYIPVHGVSKITGVIYDKKITLIVNPPYVPPYYSTGDPDLSCSVPTLPKYPINSAISFSATLSNAPANTPYSAKWYSDDPTSPGSVMYPLVGTTDSHGNATVTPQNIVYRTTGKKSPQVVVSYSDGVVPKTATCVINAGSTGSINVSASTDTYES